MQKVLASSCFHVFIFACTLRARCESIPWSRHNDRPIRIAHCFVGSPRGLVSDGSSFIPGLSKNAYHRTLLGLAPPNTKAEIYVFALIHASEQRRDDHAKKNASALQLLNKTAVSDAVRRAIVGASYEEGTHVFPAQVVVNPDSSCTSTRAREGLPCCRHFNSQSPWWHARGMLVGFWVLLMTPPPL